MFSHVMDAQKVDLFIAMNGNKFPEGQLYLIREKLLQCDEKKGEYLSSIQFKDPTTALVLSLFLGMFGIVRFYIGDTGMGVGKLISFLLLGWAFIGLVWPLVDCFLIMKATREDNLLKLNRMMLM